MLINEYLKMIYLKYIPKKSFKFIDNIVLYTENKQVYKVLLRYTDRSPHALRKLKIYNRFHFIPNPPEEIISDEIVINDKHERLTIIFDKKTERSNIVVGEIQKVLAN